MTIWLALLGCVGAFVEKMFGPKEEFAIYRDQISVVSSQLSHRISGSNLIVTVVGTVTNRSSIGWKSVGVEAQFLDKSDKLIDAITVDADYSPGIVILPHGEATFKIEGKAARPETDYEKYKVSVRWAKDVAGWP